MWFNLLIPFLVLASPLIRFGKDADDQLATLDPLFRVRVLLFLLLVRVTLGLQVLVISARRTFAQQAAQHKADPRNPAPDLKHPDVHMRGVGLDLNFMRNGQIVLGKKGYTAAQWAKVYALADLCDISNGSTFKGYADINHFYRS